MPLSDLQRRIENLEKDADGLRDEVADLKRFRAWLLGLVAGAGAIFAFMAEYLRKKLGLG